MHLGRFGFCLAGFLVLYALPVLLFYRIPWVEAIGFVFMFGLPVVGFLVVPWAASKRWGSTRKLTRDAMGGIGVGVLAFHGLVAFLPGVYTTIVPYMWLFNPQDFAYGHLVLTSFPGLAGTLLVSSWLETKQEDHTPGDLELVAGCVLLVCSTAIAFIVLAAVARPGEFRITLIYAFITVFVSGGFLQMISNRRTVRALEASWKPSARKIIPVLSLGGAMAVLVGVVLWGSHRFVGRVDEPFTSLAFLAGVVSVGVAAGWFTNMGEFPGLVGAMSVWVGTAVLVGVDLLVLEVLEVFWIVPRPLWPPDHVAPLLIVAITYLPLGMIVAYLAASGWRSMKDRT